MSVHPYIKDLSLQYVKVPFVQAVFSVRPNDPERKRNTYMNELTSHYSLY